MISPLRGSQLKVERAKRHLAEVEREMIAFFDRRPFAKYTEVEPDTGDRLTRIRIREPVPVELGPLVGDVIHNLRSAFDLLAADVVVAGGGTVSNSTEFPVSYAEDHFRKKGIHKVKGASPAAIALIERHQPYRDGNEPLLQLHRLDILDKHQSLILVGATNRQVKMNVTLTIPDRAQPVEFPTLTLNAAEPTFPLEQGSIIFRELAGAWDQDARNHSLRYQFPYEVAFGVEQVAAGQPVLPALDRYLQFTEATIETFRRELFPDLPQP